MFRDSMVCFHWNIKYTVNFEKNLIIVRFCQKQIELYIDKICAKMPIIFNHDSDAVNFSDYLSQPTSRKVLSKSSYY